MYFKLVILRITYSDGDPDVDIRYIFFLGVPGYQLPDILSCIQLQLQSANCKLQMMWEWVQVNFLLSNLLEERELGGGFNGDLMTLQGFGNFLGFSFARPTRLS